MAAEEEEAGRVWYDLVILTLKGKTHHRPLISLSLSLLIGFHMVCFSGFQANLPEFACSQDPDLFYDGELVEAAGFLLPDFQQCAASLL